MPTSEKTVLGLHPKRLSMSDIRFLVDFASVPFALTYVTIWGAFTSRVKSDVRSAHLSRIEWLLVTSIMGTLVGVAVIDIIGALLLVAWWFEFIDWSSVAIVPLGHVVLLSAIFVIMVMRHVQYVRSREGPYKSLLVSF